MSIPAITSYSLNTLEHGIKNRVDWQINPNQAVLLIHDMQQYFVDFFDENAEPIQSVVKNIQQIKIACKNAGIPVVYTAQPGDQSTEDRALLTDFWGTGLKSNDAVTQILPLLAPEDDDLVLTKWRYSAFQRTDLKQLMNDWQRDQLIIVGVYSHIGCLQTAAEAFMSDIKAFMVSDAQADFSPQEHQMALNYTAGRCGSVTSTEQVLDAINIAQQAFSIPTSKTMLVEQIAQLLEIPADELTFEDSLLDFGLDSVRMMSLIADWQQDGLNMTFIELAAKPCLQDWWQLLEAKAA